MPPEKYTHENNTTKNAENCRSAFLLADQTFFLSVGLSEALIPMAYRNKIPAGNSANATQLFNVTARMLLPQNRDSKDNIDPKCHQPDMNTKPSHRGHLVGKASVAFSLRQ
jgi:hypothetical protein